MNLEQIVIPLIDWYKKEKRELPWRINSNPYYIWISEIMLQQTRVDAVIEYYKRFLTRIPNVEELASIHEDELLKLWQGLGYYNRARNLKKAASVIVNDYNGIFPNTYQELLQLPGIGDYTAGAIASISFSEKVPAVDGNVLRVISRVTGSYKDIALLKTKEFIKKELLPILPNDISSFNQGIMELGALICLPNGEPLCQKCPLNKFCIAKIDNLTSVIPVKKKNKKRRVEERTILIIRSHNKIAIQKRASKGLLANLYEYPNMLNHLTKQQVLNLLEIKDNVIRLKELNSAKHIFSHIEWHMIGYIIDLDQFEKKDSYIWANADELEGIYAIPNAFSYYTKQIKEHHK